mgnify:CR=1 FL=1
MEKFVRPRPEFPKRAVVTAGMPYGNKELHFAHFGGYMVHADTFARFLRDRIGSENVVFVSSSAFSSSGFSNFNPRIAGEVTTAGKVPLLSK